MNSFLGLLARIAIVLAGLAVLAITAALAAAVVAALMLRSAWRRLFCAVYAHGRPPRSLHAAVRGFGAREAVVDVVARDR